MAMPRRNGQLSSCEPCRISKLRCDHNSPACSRCIRMGRLDLCVYHPAPMSRPKQQPKLPAARKTKRKSLSTTTSRTAQRGSISLTPVSLLATLSTAETRKGECFADWCKQKTLFSTPGFLGLTSHTAVFREYDQSLQIEELNSESPLISSDLTRLDRSQIEQGAQILLLLEHISHYRNILESPYNIWEPMVIGSPFLCRLWESFEKLYQDSIDSAKERSSAALSLSKKIFENTSTPIVTTPSTTFMEYVSQIAPRWEAIGIFFSRIGMVCKFIPGSDPVFQQDGSPIRDKKGYYELAVKVSDMCLQFCDKLGHVNDPMCWLTLQNTLLLSHTYGMGDYRTWQKLGDLTTILFTLGYHQLEPDDHAPFFLTELRRRAMVSAYGTDKRLAIFLGRPPRICWQYCNITPPLDLLYNEMVADVEERDAALAKLNEDGRDTDDFLMKRSWARFLLMLSMHRENILELSLNRWADNIAERGEKLIRASHRMRMELPPHLFSEHESQSSPNFTIESLHLEFIYTDFLLYRALVKRTGDQLEALIQTSLEILNMLHIIIVKQARTNKCAPCLSLDLYHIGLPAAGVLAVELLRRFRPASQTMYPTSTQFPRSEIIQKLSVYVSHVETLIWPEETDYDRAKQEAGAICQVLDRILSHEPLPQPLSSASLDLSDPDRFVSGDLSLIDETELMTWLENVNWAQESILNFS